MRFEDVQARFDPSRADSVGEQFDVWLTLLALIACMETLGVCCLATWRYARKVYNVQLQCWTMRIILIGPVYSWLMWFSLWTPSMDYYIAIPVGIYEAYAFFCFYALLVCFADGEERAVIALSGTPGPPTAYVYYPWFQTCVSSSQYTPLFGGRVHYAPLMRFNTSRELLAYLRRGVLQAMVVKPLTIVMMLVLNSYGYINYANYSRILAIVSFWLVANSLTQLYHVILPRIRGLGGEKLFVLLLFMVIVLIIQDIVVSALLVNSGTSSATSELPTRLIFVFTILEFTAFVTIFYRLLPPEKFGQLAWTNSNSNLNSLASSTPPAVHMSVASFVWIIIDPRTVFSVPKGKRDPHLLRHHSGGEGMSNHTLLRCSHTSFSNASLSSYDDSYGGVKESKRCDSEDLCDENTPLVKNFSD